MGQGWHGTRRQLLHLSVEVGILIWHTDRPPCKCVLEFVNCVVYNKWEVDDLNIHVPTEDKNHDSWDSFYEELKCVFEQSKNHMGDFSAKVWRGDIFNLKIGRQTEN